jgi:flagellar biogenesis protein FliO
MASREKRFGNELSISPRRETGAMHQERPSHKKEGWSLAAWLIAMFARRRRAPEKQMELLETLQLGGKRQLLLVNCGGQRYLVGGGADSVDTIQALERGAATPMQRVNAKKSIPAAKPATAVKSAAAEKPVRAGKRLRAGKRADVSQSVNFSELVTAGGMLEYV